jgi:uncharacterized protein YqjF (DUF2071 family)
MHPLLRHTDHRPWPVPRRAWVGRQSWQDLLFAHYRVEASVLRPFIPRALRLQEEDGLSWIGVVPFRMSGVMLRGLPDLPGISAFPEINVRLYVEHDGKPGVWFLSLDATNPIAVWTARRFFHLPYRRARIEIQLAKPESTGAVDPPETEYRYSSELLTSAVRARFNAQYRPITPVRSAVQGTVEYLLTERYCFYAMSPSGRLYRTEVHHMPWPLQTASGQVDSSDLLFSDGIELKAQPDLLHFAKGIDVITWAPEPVENT